MKNIKFRVGDLELRKTKSFGVNGIEYLEIVEWYEKKLCYTIATFKEYDEGHKLISVGDRIVLDAEKWKDFGVLVRYGFDFLKDIECLVDEVKKDEN